MGTDVQARHRLGVWEINLDLLIGDDRDTYFLLGNDYWEH